MHYQLLSLVRKTGIATAAGAGILCIQLSAAGVANAAAFPGNVPPTVEIRSAGIAG